MPHKTREEKIRADTKRQKVVSPAFTYTAKTSLAAPSHPAIQTGDLTFIRKDLLKTLILALFFIGCEVGLSIYSRQLGW